MGAWIYGEAISAPRWATCLPKTGLEHTGRCSLIPRKGLAVTQASIKSRPPLGRFTGRRAICHGKSISKFMLAVADLILFVHTKSQFLQEAAPLLRLGLPNLWCWCSWIFLEQGGRPKREEDSATCSNLGDIRSLNCSFFPSRFCKLPCTCRILLA